MCSMQKNTCTYSKYSKEKTNNAIKTRTFKPKISQTTVTTKYSERQSHADAICLQPYVLKFDAI